MGIGIAVDATGVTTPSLPEAYEEMLRRYAEVFGVDLSDAPQTPQSQLAAVQAVMGTEFGAALTAALNAMSLDRATGTQLDDIGSLVGATRRGATRSRVTATLYGVAATNVPAGSRAKTASGDEFRTLAAATLSPSGVQVGMEAVNTGPVEAAAGTLTSVVTIVAGWERITNASDAVVGRARESDNEYRLSLFVRAARNALGTLGSLEAALVEAETTRYRVVERQSTDTATAVVQEWSLRPSSLLVVAEGATDSDVRRAVENHRGQGVGTMTAIRGGTPDNTALDAITNGAVTWNGANYTGLDLSAANTPALKAAALTTLLAMATPAPTVSYIAGAYVAIYPWKPDATPEFGTGAVETAFGLVPAAASAAPGPFVRPRSRALVIALAVTRDEALFPSDGLAQIRTAVNAVIAGYEIGQQLWSNDILAAVERIPGTQVTSISVQANSADVSNVAVPLDQVWALAAADLTVTIA